MSHVNNNETSLTDYIDYDLKILSVGLNPSIISVQKEFYFANPRNRFWRAFNQAKIISEQIIPDKEIHKKMLEQYAIGFTDVAKRPSSMGHELRAEDFKKDAPNLKERIFEYKPEIVWFHGKIAITKFMQYGCGVKSEWSWGFNQVDHFESKIFVTPNPSPANAAFSLEDLINRYRAIKLI